jgi:pre-mRNA-splicing factor SYF1
MNALFGKLNIEEEESDELEYRVRRLEKLLDRRGILLSNCVLRNNPNDVSEWLKRLTVVGGVKE